MSRFDDHAGILTTLVPMMLVIVIGACVLMTFQQELVEKGEPAMDAPTVNAGGFSPVVSYGGLYGEASGEVTQLSSVGDEWVVNFKDDLSDYRFAGVDSMELYLLQYAFENLESVTVQYTVEDHVKTLEGVTLLSPGPPSAPTEPTIEKSSDGFNWWLLPMVMVGPLVTVAFMIVQHRRSRRLRQQILEYEPRTISEDEPRAHRVRRSSPSKKKEEPEEEPVVPLDGRYRVQQADELLAERNSKKKKKNMKERKNQ